MNSVVRQVGICLKNPVEDDLFLEEQIWAGQKFLIQKQGFPVTYHERIPFSLMGVKPACKPGRTVGPPIRYELVSPQCSVKAP